MEMEYALGACQLVHGGSECKIPCICLYVCMLTHV